MITKSQYANHYTFKEGITQLSALKDNLKDHPGMRDEADEDYERMRPINPCNFDFVFHGVRKGMLQYILYGCMSIMTHGHRVVNFCYIYQHIILTQMCCHFLLLFF